MFIEELLIDKKAGKNYRLWIYNREQ